MHAHINLLVAAVAAPCCAAPADIAGELPEAIALLKQQPADLMYEIREARVAAGQNKTDASGGKKRNKGW
jgi:hypothetical protein